MGKIIAILIGALFLTCCAAPVPSWTTSKAPAALAPIPTATVVSNAPEEPGILVTPTVEVISTSTPLAPQICPREQVVCDLDGHFWMIAPIGEGNKKPSIGYGFGSTQNKTRETHHGVEFENPTGTDVISAADGEVVFAGRDDKTVLAWIQNFYGNVVVVRHDFEGYPQPVFTLYAHLSAISVNLGETVTTGEKIGEVGSTGTAQGPHLHFEVRIGENLYKSVASPLLWVMPEDQTGVVAGSIVDTDGKFHDGTINVQKIVNGELDPNPVTGIQTYDGKLLPVSGDVTFEENFAAGGLPVGEFRLSLVYNGKIFEKIIEVKSKRLTYVNFIVE